MSAIPNLQKAQIGIEHNGLTAVSERGYFGGRPRRLGGGGSVSVSAGLPAA